MRKTCLIILLFFIASITVNAQNTGEDSTGLPGDNFSLQGALEMFKKANSIEEFEKLINTENNGVNNLDLNGDGEIDYVRIIDKADGDAHVFILQVPVSATESQDIAVIELEKTGSANAMVQIIGDEDIYGEETIVEPNGGDEEATDKNGSGPSFDLDQLDTKRIVVNVWFWPSVRFIYAPGYRVWVSPWKWRHYPVWWKPWRPFAWHVFHPRRVHYHRGFVFVHTHRVIHAHKIYKPVRVTSVTVRTRNMASVNNYRVKRSKTTVTGPRGNSVTKKSTTVQGPRGNKVKKTTVKRKRG